METHLRAIGNSRGVIIPASMLRDCNIEHEIRLIQEGARLIIESAKKPRENWFPKNKALQALAKQESPALGLVAEASDAALDAEWDW
jgi:antitoxin MazE